MTPQTPWHTQTAAAASAALEADPARGLCAEAAQRRLANHGENRLVEAKPRPLWLKFLDQFKNLLVIVLLFAAALAWVVGDLQGRSGDSGRRGVQRRLGFYQEYRAEQTLAALKSMLAAARPGAPRWRV